MELLHQNHSSTFSEADDNSTIMYMVSKMEIMLEYIYKCSWNHNYVCHFDRQTEFEYYALVFDDHTFLIPLYLVILCTTVYNWKLFRFGRRENCDCEYSDILSCLSSPGTVTTGCIGMDLFDIVSMLYPSNSAVKEENNV